MIRETIYFKLRLRPDTNKFFAALNDVQRRMTELGVEPGRPWNKVTGDGRWVMIEREFDSLAAYEQDDHNFHAGEDFMTRWLEMESYADQLRGELWQSPNPTPQAR